LSRKSKIEKAEFLKPLKSLSSENDKRVFSLLQRLNTIKKEKTKLKKEKEFEKKRIKDARELSCLTKMKEVFTEKKKARYKKQKRENDKEKEDY